MTILRIVIAFVVWSQVAAVWAEEQPDFIRIWTIEKPLCPGKCGKFTFDYVTRFVGKQIDVGRDWFTNDMFESCLHAVHYDDITHQDAAQFLSPYKVKPASLGIRQKKVWAGRVFCNNTAIATLIYVNDKKMIMVFEHGVYVPLK